MFSLSLSLLFFLLCAFTIAQLGLGLHYKIFPTFSILIFLFVTIYINQRILEVCVFH